MYNISSLQVSSMIAMLQLPPLAAECPLLCPCHRNREEDATSVMTDNKLCRNLILKSTGLFFLPFRSSLYRLSTFRLSVFVYQVAQALL